MRERRAHNLPIKDAAECSGVRLRRGGLLPISSQHTPCQVDVNCSGFYHRPLRMQYHQTEKIKFTCEVDADLAEAGPCRRA